MGSKSGFHEGAKMQGSGGDIDFENEGKEKKQTKLSDFEMAD